MSAQRRVASGAIRNAQQLAHNGGLHMLQCIQKHMDNTVGSRQGEIIIGTLLGDGFLERNGNYFRLIIDHSLKQLPYLQYKHDHLKDFGGRIVLKKRFDSRTGKFYDHCLYRTRTSSILAEYQNLFYVKKRKSIPSNLPKIITPQILAIWFMDDGYKRNDCNAARLNTQSYSLEEHMVIQQALLNLGIQSKIHKQKQNFVTYIPSSSMNKFRGLIKDFIIPEMKYKIV